jgi:NAD(P)-dependent dehydrogenase (short-subunit alcohol dehydrogenase family)
MTTASITGGSGGIGEALARTLRDQAGGTERSLTQLPWKP